MAADANTTSLVALASAGGVAALIQWFERRKDKRSEAQPQGDSQVVAASFVDKRALGDLTQAILGLHGGINVLIGHVEKMNDRLHEDELVRAAVARMREERS